MRKNTQRDERAKRVCARLVKILAGIAITVIALLLLMIIYRVLEFLLMAAIILIGFGVVPVFWWR